jgi:hypothetical protein
MMPVESLSQLDRQWIIIAANVIIDAIVTIGAPPLSRMDHKLHHWR